MAAKFVISSNHELGDAWASNTINTSIYRGAGLVTAKSFQFGAYYEEVGSLVVFRRDLHSGECRIARLPSPTKLLDAHNGISLGVDAAGFLHLSHDHHGSALNYRRSSKPLAIEHWGTPSAMTGLWEDNVTYPYFLTRLSARHPLLFLYRRGNAQRGDLRIKSYDHKRYRWVDMAAPLLSGSGQNPWTAGPYMNHPAIGPDERIHLFFTWRTRPVGPQSYVNNHNFDYATADPTGAVWESSSGHVFDMPITPVNAETALGTGPACNLINQSGAAVNSKGQPFAVSFMADPSGALRYFLLWRTAGEWRRQWLPLGNQAYDFRGEGTLPSPLGRADLVIDASDTVWVIFRAAFTGNCLSALPLRGPDYVPAPDMLQILWDEDLLFCEPVIDRVRWRRDGVLSMYVQRADQGDREALGAEGRTRARVVEWELR